MNTCTFTDVLMTMNVMNTRHTASLSAGEAGQPQLENSNCML